MAKEQLRKMVGCYFGQGHQNGAAIPLFRDLGTQL